MLFQDYIFSLFPARFKRDDTYKDINGLGVFERYVRAFGYELDEDIVPYIEDAMDVTNALICDEKFLNHISDSIGNPPDIFLDNTMYRKLLAYAFTLYKIKGTIESYNLLFSLLGINVVITEFPQEFSLWDELLYDEDFYDIECLSCAEYSLGLSSVLDDCSVPTITTIPTTTMDIITEIIEFLQPINARLRELYQTGGICEIVEHCILEDISFELSTTVVYDEGIYDIMSYDEPILISSLNKAYDCQGEEITDEGIGYWIIEDDFELQ